MQMDTKSCRMYCKRIQIQSQCQQLQHRIDNALTPKFSFPNPNTPIEKGKVKWLFQKSERRNLRRFSVTVSLYLLNTNLRGSIELVDHKAIGCCQQFGIGGRNIMRFSLHMNG